MPDLLSTPSYFECKNSFGDYGSQFEILVSILYHHIVRTGDTVIDGGANSGLHAVPLAKLISPCGSLFAFEPDPYTFSGLSNNLRANIQNGTVHCVQKALSNKEETLKFINYPGKGANNHVYTGTIRDLGVKHEEITVQATTLDNEIPSKHKVSFIKLDLEGYDFLALQGASKVIKNSSPIFVFENSRDYTARTNGYTSEVFFSWFDQFGYDIYDLHCKALTIDSWLEPDMCFEFIALPKNQEYSHKILELMSRFWGEAKDRKPITDWNKTKQYCLSPEKYYLFPF